MLGQKSSDLLKQAS